MSRGTPVEELISQARAEGTYIETLVVGAYWGPRPEPPEAVAWRMLATLLGLEDLGVTGGQPWWDGDAPLPLEEAALGQRGRSNLLHKMRATASHCR
jgi:hypothetical protein